MEDKGAFAVQINIKVLDVSFGKQRLKAKRTCIED